jgi:hypothetical protein
MVLHEIGTIGKALKRASTAIGFGFFHFSFEYLKRLQSSEPLHTKMNPPSCLFGSWFVQNPFFLLAGALLFAEKIHQRAALFWFGLQECWNSSNILLMNRKPKFPVCAHTNRDPNKQEVGFIFV